VGKRYEERFGRRLRAWIRERKAKSVVHGAWRKDFHFAPCPLPSALCPTLKHLPQEFLSPPTNFVTVYPASL